MLPRLASYLLGAFVCVELLYLPLANFLQPVPRRPDPLPDEILGRFQVEGRSSDSEIIQQAIDATGRACDRWAEATAQNQGWSLFAPRFGAAGTFLTLEMLSTDGTRTELRSRFEPPDPSHYVRFDVRNYRLFYREMSYALIYATWTPESFAKQAKEWRDAIRDYVTVYRRSMSAYVRWRIATDMPGAAVQEITVAVRVFLSPKPGEPHTRPAAISVPLAKWDPAAPDHLVPFDPLTGRFRSD
jgi:hypothetical protein